MTILQNKCRQSISTCNCLVFHRAPVVHQLKLTFTWAFIGHGRLIGVMDDQRGVSVFHKGVSGKQGVIVQNPILNRYKEPKLIKTNPDNVTDNMN